MKHYNYDIFTFIAISMIYIILMLFFIVTITYPSLFFNLAVQNKKQELGLLLNEGIKKSLERDYNKSLEIFNSVIKEMPELPEAYVNKAVTLKVLKNFPEALNNLKFALKYKIRDSANVFLNFKDIYFELGDTVKAEIYLRKAINSIGNNIEKDMIIGNHYFNIKKLDSAYMYYNNALKKRFIPVYYISDSIKTKFSQEKLNYFVKKVFDFNSFLINLHSDKGLAENFNKLGVVLALQKNYDEAFKCFMKAINIWKDYKDANDNLKFVTEKLNKNRKL